MKISFSPPDITENEINEVIDTLKSGWITTGPKTKLFEKNITDYTNASGVVCMNSATASMEATLRLLGIGADGEVITTAYTFSATASVIEHVGAKIVLVDTAKDSYQMDYDQLENAITHKTKAIIPVDIAGVMCDYDRIYEIVARKQSLFQPTNDIQKVIGRITIIADAAHSFGAVYKGKQSGEVADFTCFSFHAVKNLTTAEGGAVAWKQITGIDSKQIYKEYMLLTLHGQSKDALAKTQLGAWEYDIIYPGYKSNMTDITASLGLAQLRRYDSILQRRKEIISKYNKGLKEYPVTCLQHDSKEYASSGHLYLVRLNEKNEVFRNSVVEKMAQRGIATNVHYKPLPMLTAYKNLGFDISDYPNSFHMYQNEITLPLHTLLTDEEVQYVIDSFGEILCE